MRGYPISSFLFWEVNENNIPKFQFYEFIRNFHEKNNRHNEKANLIGKKSITAILDGQQRLTSLYIGLKGSYSYKIPRMRRDNEQAYPTRKLCLNLLGKPTDCDMEYDFRFLTTEEANKSDDSHFWYTVSDILSLKEAGDVNSFLIDNDLLSADKEKAKFANNTLYKLFNIVNEPSLNFFLESSDSLDKVLNIFIRVNSGGTKLSYSDLLLSIASAQWEGVEAREAITKFVDEINNLGDGFNINKDFVLKTCLVLSDFSDIAFKVDNFSHSNMETIEKNWESITESIRIAYTLLLTFGYNRESLSSNNAVIPIAYYIHKIGNPQKFDIANKFDENRKRIFKWLTIGLLKKVFSGQPDNVLRPIRDIIRNASDENFPLNEIIEKQRGSSKSFILTDDDIEALFDYQYGNAYTYSLLAMLYSSLNFRVKFHEDHIFPKTLFTESKLLKLGVPKEDISFYLDNYNCIANLQLLEGIPNQEKSKRNFDEWIMETYPNESDRKLYMQRNYIPDCGLAITNFKEFIEKRKDLIRNAIKEKL